MASAEGSRGNSARVEARVVAGRYPAQIHLKGFTSCACCPSLDSSHNNTPLKGENMKNLTGTEQEADLINQIGWLVDMEDKNPGRVGYEAFKAAQEFRNELLELRLTMHSNFDRG